MQHVKNTNCPICNAYLGTKPWNQLMYAGQPCTHCKAWADLVSPPYLRPDPVIEDLARKFLPDFRLKEDKEGEQSCASID